jgi:glycosyltransferase involved in cell wall biosynthesis
MISVIVPVKNQWQHTSSLLNCLRQEPCQVLVMDNGSTDDTTRCLRIVQRQNHYWQGRLHWTTKRQLSVYELWNYGFQWARTQRDEARWYVLITNNDILLPPGALSAMRAALEPLDNWIAYPDYDAPWSPQRVPGGDWRETRGVLSDGGMFGACFMVAGHRIPWRPLITDTTYEWWYGDNHLAEEVEQHGGKQIRVVGLPVQHVNEATASLMQPTELYGMKFRDRQRWITRYNR